MLGTVKGDIQDRSLHMNQLNKNKLQVTDKQNTIYLELPVKI